MKIAGAEKCPFDLLKLSYKNTSESDIRIGELIRKGVNTRALSKVPI